MHPEESCLLVVETVRNSETNSETTDIRGALSVPSRFSTAGQRAAPVRSDRPRRKEITKISLRRCFVPNRTACEGKMVVWRRPGLLRQRNSGVPSGVVVCTSFPSSSDYTAMSILRVARWRSARGMIEWLCTLERLKLEIAIILGAAARYRRASSLQQL
jgi:hypothetical protein